MGNLHGLAESQNNILILGGTGNIGKQTVRALCDDESVLGQVYVGSRNIKTVKACNFKETIKALQVNQGKEEDVAQAVKEQNISTVFVIPPSDENRKGISIAAIRGAKKGGAKNLVVASVISVPYAGTLFADQLLAVEEEAKKSGLSYVILRLTFFAENIFGQMKPIAETSKFYGMISGDKVHSAVTTYDAGRAAAEVLKHPLKYKNRTFNIVSHVFSQNELAKELSAAVGSKIEYIQVSEDNIKHSFLSNGFPEWRVNGVIELYKLVDLKLEAMLSKGESEDLQLRPTSLAEFVRQIGPTFKKERGAEQHAPK